MGAEGSIVVMPRWQWNQRTDRAPSELGFYTGRILGRRGSRGLDVSRNRSGVFGSPLSRVSDCRPHLRPLAALADGPIADTAEPVTAQAEVVGSEPDGDDGDAMLHV